MTLLKVTVSIISEQQANTLLKNDKMGKGEASGEILNNTGTMEYQKASRQLSVSFRYDNNEDVLNASFKPSVLITEICSCEKLRELKRKAPNP